MQENGSTASCAALPFFSLRNPQFAGLKADPAGIDPEEKPGGTHPFREEL